MNKFWKKISVVLVTITASLIVPMVSLAADDTSSLFSIGGFADSAVQGIFSRVTLALQWFTQYVGYLIAFVTAQLITFAAYIIQMMIQLSIHIMESPVVQEGFKITLSFANLGFVLAVIAISFITIFRLQGYETKKLLRNLIVAAVLINFSFTFAGLIMDATHVVGNFFIVASLGENSSNVENLTENIANSLNINKLHTTPPTAEALQAAANASDAYISTIASLSMIIFFNSMIVITFFVVAGMMIIRYIALSILLVIMPFAWLCWIFPNLKQYWDQWWGEFKKWNIFLPVLMFFIYLSLVTSDGLGKLIKNGTLGLKSADALASGFGNAPDLFVAIAQGIVQVALLFGGLVVAQKIGVAGSDAISNATSFVKNKIQGVPMTGINAMRRASGYGASGAKGGKPGEVGAGGSVGGVLPSRVYKGLGNALSAVGLQSAAANMYSAAEAPKAAAKKAVADGVKMAKETYQGKEAIQAHLQSSARSDQSKAQKIMLAAETGNLDFMKKELGDAKFGEYLKSVKNLGLEKDIATKRPDLALAHKELFDEGEADKFVGKLGASKEDWKNVDSSAFADVNLWSKLDSEQKEAVLKNRKHSQEVIKAVAADIQDGGIDNLDEQVSSRVNALIESPAIRKKIQEMDLPKGKDSVLKQLALKAGDAAQEAKKPKKNQPTIQKPIATNTGQKPASNPGRAFEVNVQKGQQGKQI